MSFEDIGRALFRTLKKDVLEKWAIAPTPAVPRLARTSANLLMLPGSG
jgi:hypothetical protein